MAATLNHNEGADFNTRAVSGLALILGLVWVLLYNPFVSLDTQIKFPLIGVLIAATLGLIGLFQTHALLRIPKAVWLLVFCLFIALVRMNETFGQFGNVTFENRVFLSLMILLIISSFSLYKLVGYRLQTGGVFLILLVTSLFLVLNFNFVWRPGYSETLGEFGYGSYQQISLILGLTCIFIYFRGIDSDLPILIRLAFSVVFLILLTLVVLNRARGEFLALIIALMSSRFPKLSLGLAVLFMANFVLFADYIAQIDLPLFARFAGLLNDPELGGRAILLSNSIELIWQKPWLAITGGGANYFQTYYNYFDGGYPHNVFLEAWITGGVVLFGVLVHLILAPLVKGYAYVFAGRTINREAFSIGIFIAVVIMKSGTLISLWPLGFFLPVFSAIIPKPTNLQSPSL